MANIYATLKNHYKFISDTIFSANFCEINEEYQSGDEIEFYINLNV